MKAVSGPEMCRLVEANGWVLQRIKGSHHIYSKPGERKIISIPVHGNRDLKTGLASRIARDAGVEIDFLETFLSSFKACGSLPSERQPQP